MFVASWMAYEKNGYSWIKYVFINTRGQIVCHSYGICKMPLSHNLFGWINIANEIKYILKWA